jgi:hypothetical protein
MIVGFTSKLPLKVMVVIVLVFIIVLMIENSNNSNVISHSNRELLSSDIQITDGQPIRTYNGIVPLTKCPAGSYRPSGGSNLVLVSGQLKDGCIHCPRGRYGLSVGSSNPQCDAPCPTGRFGKNLGLKAVGECELCPPGRYGSVVGVSTPCDACPQGKYNPEYGKSSVKDCLTCPPGYSGWQCNWPVAVNNPNKVA